MNNIATNTLTITFMLQFYELVSKIKKYEYILQRYQGVEVYTVIKGQQGSYKYQVTPELVTALKYAAFERYSCLRMLGAKEMLGSFLEQQTGHNQGGESNAPILRQRQGQIRSGRPNH
jgi:hypothetical protein